MRRSRAALWPAFALAALVGCTPGDARDEHERAPKPPPAARRPPGQPPPAQQPQQPPAAPAPAAPTDQPPKEPSARTARLARDLDSPDTDRVFFATVTLLSEWATQPAETAGLAAIAAHLKAGTPEQQRTLVKAIRDFHALPGPTDAEKKRAAPGLVPLLEPFLGSSEPLLRRGAVEALAAIDALWADDPTGDEVDVMLTRILQVRRSSFELVSAVRLIGRKPVKFAVPRLLDAIERFSAWAEVEATAFDELHASTGQDFGHDLQAARDWWAKNADRRPDEWFRERLAKSEDETARARMAARTYWQRYVSSLANDPGLFNVLRETLSFERCEIPRKIRADAGRQLADVGTPAAYQALVDALKVERDRNVVRQLLDDIGTMARTPPDEPEELRRTTVDALVPRLTDVDKDVRIAAINALAYVGLDQALPPILACLRGRARNADVVLAVFQAVSRLGVKGNPGAVGQVLSFFKDEWARDAKDPARDPRIFRECANTLKSLAQRKEITAGSPNAAAVLGALLQLLEFEEPGNVAPSTRQFAAIALGKLGMPSALAPLEQRLDEKVEPDAGVAAYAASAIAEIAATPDVKPLEREAALSALRVAFDVRRDPQFKDAAFDAARALLALEPGNLTGFVTLADKLAQSNDWPRVVKLLKETLPEKAPAGAEAVHLALRERLAAALASMGKPDDADKALADLIRTAPPEVTPRLWATRAALVKKLADTGDAAGASRVGAQILAGTGPLVPPAEIVSLVKRALEPAASPQQPKGPEGHSTGTVPTGLVAPEPVSGGGLPVGGSNR